MTRSASYLVVVLIVCTGCNASGREQSPAQSPGRDLAAEVSALQLSQMCSTAAETFWRRNKYDHPATPTKGTTDNWGYQSHYNAEQKRCFVLVELVTQLPSGDSTQHQEVFDAIEGGEPLAIMQVHKTTIAAAPRIDLLKANTAIPSTPENLQWFRGLMSK
jgi:hypothetical protein